MEGIIKIGMTSETCGDCFCIHIQSDVDVEKRKYKGYKSTRPEWCPIERRTYHRQSLEVDKKEEFYE